MYINSNIQNNSNGNDKKNHPNKSCTMACYYIGVQVRFISFHQMVVYLSWIFVNSNQWKCAQCINAFSEGKLNHIQTHSNKKRHRIKSKRLSKAKEWKTRIQKKNIVKQKNHRNDNNNTEWTIQVEPKKRQANQTHPLECTCHRFLWMFTDHKSFIHTSLQSFRNHTETYTHTHTKKAPIESESTWEKWSNKRTKALSSMIEWMKSEQSPQKPTNWCVPAANEVANNRNNRPTINTSKHAKCKKTIPIALYIHA